MDGRRRWIGLICVLLALLGVALAGDEAVSKGVLRRALAGATADVAVLGGLRDAAGRLDRAPPGGLPVEVFVDGDAPWLAEVAAQVVDADPAFKVADGPHQVRFEYVADGRTWAIRAQLWRQGWSLRPPDPVIGRVFPWVAVLAALLGGALALRRVPIAIASLVAAGGAQLGMSLAAWPEGLAKPPYAERVADGPLGRAFVDAARSLPDIAVSVGAGVVVLCLVLIAFDHRRTRGQGGWLVASGLVCVLAGGAWLEAAWRGGVDAWLSTGLGALGGLGLLGVWVVAGVDAWRRRGDVNRPPVAAEDE